MGWICLLFVVGGLALFVGATFLNHHRQQKNEHDQVGPMVFKVGASVLMLIIFFACISMGKIGMLLAIVPGVLLGFIWIGSVSDLFMGGVMNWMTGEGEEVEPKPFYSVAETMRHRGDPQGAIAEIKDQLSRFSGDFEGQMMMAEIQVETLKDFPAATATLRTIFAQDHHAIGQFTRAMNTLADWQLKYAEDKDAARATLRGIMQRFPNTGAELLTAQRLARMDAFIEYNDARDAGQVVSDCLKQLEQHPLDNDTREKLACVYFERYDQPKQAWAELNTLIQRPFQQSRDVCRWLNMAADWHVKLENIAGARGAMQQIIALFPNTALAETAASRLTKWKDR
ncbi:MAG: tetratricopeptide repeat protein [Limisphaerales bacterium]